MGPRVRLKRLKGIVPLIVVVWMPAAAFAQQDRGSHGLSQQVQEMEAAVLSVAAGPGRLEEKRLHLSGRQVAVFIPACG